MLTKSKNKMIEKEVENKETQEFHFPGGMEYEPIAIKASTREEAEEIWKKSRRKVNK